MRARDKMNSYRDHQVLTFDRPGKIRKKTQRGVASTHPTLVRPRVNIAYPFWLIIGTPIFFSFLSFFFFNFFFFYLGGKRMAKPLGN